MKKVAVILMTLTFLLSLMAGTVLAKSDNSGGSKNHSSNVNKAQTNSEKKPTSETERQQKIKDIISKSSAASDYSDTKTHWSSEAVKKVKALGWIKGYEDGSFKPDASISTLEITAVAVRVAETLGTDISDDTSSNEEDAADDPGVPDWAVTAVNKADALKIININRYHSQLQASRAQAAIMLAKALKLEPVVSSELSFPDVADLTAEDIGYLLALQHEGVIKGSPDGKFNPNSSLTRAEIATMLARIAEKETDTGNTGTTNPTPGDTTTVPTSGETENTNPPITGGTETTNDTASSSATTVPTP